MIAMDAFELPLRYPQPSSPALRITSRSTRRLERKRRVACRAHPVGFLEGKLFVHNTEACRKKTASRAPEDAGLLGSSRHRSLSRLRSVHSSRNHSFSRHSCCCLFSNLSVEFTGKLRPDRGRVLKRQRLWRFGVNPSSGRPVADTFFCLDSEIRCAMV